MARGRAPGYFGRRPADEAWGSARPGRLFHPGRRWSLQGDEGPVRLPVSSLQDPVPDFADLDFGELADFFPGRHLLVGVGMGEAFEEKAFSRVAGNYEGLPFPFRKPVRFLIEA